MSNPEALDPIDPPDNTNPDSTTEEDLSVDPPADANAKIDPPDNT